MFTYKYPSIAAFFLLGVCLLAAPVTGFSKEKVVLQLKWTHAFQFAGYYAAQALGYYDELGLEVEIRPASPGINPVDEVVQGRAHFGVGNSSLLLDRYDGKPVVALGVIFQHSPAIFIASGNGEISSIEDLKGKRIMIEPNSSELLAYLKKSGVNAQQAQIMEHSYQVDDLIKGDVDVISAYSSNEPYTLNHRGFFFKIFTPREVGIDFYGDNLFTTEAEIAAHPARVEAFRQASLRGWAYAMENKLEVIDIILAKYGKNLKREQLLFETQVMQDLLANDLIEVGYMNPKRWQRIVAAYQTIGELKEAGVLEGFIYQPPRGVLDIIKADYMVLMKYLLAVLAIVSFLVYRNYQLRGFNQKLERIAQTDQLTGALNRKGIDTALENAFAHFVRYRQSFTVIMADIDNFKQVNDCFGHHIGDDVIRQIADLLSANVAVKDKLGRWGGEEFMLICPAIDADSGLQLAEQLRIVIEGYGFAAVGHQTISLGVAVCKEGDQTQDIVKRADGALYKAKRAGRNKVVVAAC